MVGLAGELVKGGKLICFCFQGLDMSYHLKAPSERYLLPIHHGSFSCMQHPLVLAALTYLSAKDVFFVGSSFIEFCLMLSITRRQVQCFLG